MGDQVLPLPLTERTVHLCVDMQWIFSAEGPWPTPWMDKVLPVAAALANRHPARTVSPVSFRPCVATRCPACGNVTTRAGVLRPERLDSRLLELMPQLAALCPLAEARGWALKANAAEIPRLREPRCVHRLSGFLV